MKTRTKKKGPDSKQEKIKAEEDKETSTSLISLTGELISISGDGRTKLKDCTMMKERKAWILLRLSD